MLSLGISFGVQVLIVRYLSKSDFGAFAYALSLALFLSTLTRLGLDRAVTRFIPIFEERGEYDKLAGTLIFCGAVVGGFGVLVLLALYVLAGPLGVSPLPGGEARTVLLVLVVLAPLDALNDLLVGLFAVFSRPKAIFFRRYLLTSGLRLVVAGVLIATGSEVVVLAVGYVLAEAIGVLIALLLFIHIVRADGLLPKLRRVVPRVPAREILGFTLPLLTTDLVYAVMILSDVVILGHYAGADAVAALRAIQPVAQLNQIVFASFIFLFTPTIARLFAREERGKIEDVYWHTAGWITLLSSPVFLLTFSLAAPLTALLFGARYSDSALLLAILSLGYYAQSALGFNGTTLMVFGRIGVLIGLNCIAVTVNVAANLIAIPAFGPVGAATATTATLVAHNVLKQIALRRAAGVRFFRAEYARAYVTVALAAGGLAAAAAALQWSAASFAVGAVVGTLVLVANRRVLRVQEAFPELLRLPVVRRLLAPQPGH